MFGKYLKWQLKECFRTMWPLFLACLVIEGLMLEANNSSGSQAGDIAGTILVIAYGILMIALVVVTSIRIIQNFWKDTYGKDAYFKMTLPVSADQKLLADGLASFLLVLAAIAVSLVPYLFFFPTSNVQFNLIVQFDEIKYLVLFLMLVVVRILNAVYLVYLSESVASQDSSHAVLIGIAVYVAVSLLQFCVIARSGYTVVTDITTRVPSSDPDIIFWGMSRCLWIMAAFTVVFYFAERWLLKKHYNLK